MIFACARCTYSLKDFIFMVTEHHKQTDLPAGVAVD